MRLTADYVEEHEEVGDEDGGNVPVADPLYLILDGPLRGERDVQQRVGVVGEILHEPEEQFGGHGQQRGYIYSY